MAKVARPDRDELERRDSIAFFVKELRRIGVRFKWYLDKRGEVRATHGDWPHAFCPMTAIWLADCGKFRPTREIHEAAEELGFGHVSLKLVEAYDNLPEGPGKRIDQGLREQILAAVGLELERGKPSERL